jgi:hypothetical protein
MAYGYLGQNTPNQTVNNSGVFSITDSADLESQGKLGGSLELIEEQTYSSGVSFVDFTSIQENKFDVHLLQYSNVSSTEPTANVNLNIRFYESGVLETASVYQNAFQFGGTGGVFGENKSTSQDTLGVFAGNFQNSKANGYIYLYNLGNSNKYSFATGHSFFGHPTLGAFFIFGGGVLPQASTVDGIRVMISAGNYDAFNIKLYGVKQI